MNVSCCILCFMINMASKSSLKSKRNTIEEPAEKQEIWAFIDTECRVDKKIDFKWNTLFQEFQTKEFQILLQDYPNTELSKGIYNNISKFGLHWATSRTSVLPCVNVIK